MTWGVVVLVKISEQALGYPDLVCMYARCSFKRSQGVKQILCHGGILGGCFSQGVLSSASSVVNSLMLMVVL